MTNRPANWRYWASFTVLGLALVGLIARYVLVLRATAPAAEHAAEVQTISYPLSARPGGLFARSGTTYIPLAISRREAYCFADPSRISPDDLPDTVKALGPALGEDPLDLTRLIQLRFDRQFVVLKRQVTPEQAQAINKLRLPGIGVDYEWLRAYPANEAAGPLIGFRMRDGEPGGGLEMALNEQLHGTDGKMFAVADAARRPIHSAEALEPSKDGRNVFLSLDAVIQGSLQAAVSDAVQKYGAHWGVGIVVEPSTGRILALTSLPGFDPAEFSSTAPEAMTNRAITVPYEPGSVAKSLFAAAAVDAGVMTYQTVIDCEMGEYHAARGGTITDHGQRYGRMPLTDVLVFSSNIGMAKVGEALGNQALFDAARRFGLGQRTGIQLPGESPGIMRPLKAWDGYSTRRVPFGQEMSMTTLQLTMAYASLANDGLLLKPRLVDAVTDSDGHIVSRGETQVVGRTVSVDTAHKTLDVLAQVVERGSGRACKMGSWTSFGKTGTAQIAGLGGYVPNAYVGSFVGGAPVSKPAVLCCISIYWPQAHKGYYGAVVAAPYVGRVLNDTLAYLAVPPDREESAPERTAKH